MQSSAAALLLNVSAEPEGLGPTARILTLVAAILELRLLGMISAMEKLTTHEMRLAHRALEGNEPRPDLPVNVLPFDVLLIVHMLNEPV